MKKIFSLSLLAFIVLFTFFPGGALAQVGDCTFTDPYGFSFVQSGYDRTACQNAGGSWAAVAGGGTGATPAGSSSCTATPTDFQSLVYKIICIIGNSLIPLAFALAILVFVWGVVNFVILGASDETKKTQGRQLMIWGVIALAVMMSVWGLAKIVNNTFGLNTSALPSVKP